MRAAKVACGYVLMKRRDFLAGSAGLAGALLPIVGKADGRPCPPGELAVGGSASVSTTCAPSKVGPAPAWFKEVPERTWIEVAAGAGRGDLPSERRGKRLEDVRVVPDAGSSVGLAGAGWSPTVAWTGGAVDPARRELILAANGGHGDGVDNGVYLIALGAESPRWYRVVDPTPDKFLTGHVGNWPYNQIARYGDGRPVSVHGWHKQCFGNGRVWYVGQDSTAGASSYTGGIVAWDRSFAGENPAAWPISHTTQNFGGWQVHGVVMPERASPDGGVATGPSCYDPVGNKIWTFAEYSDSPRYWSVDAATAAVQTYKAALGATVNFGGLWAACADDVNGIGQPGIVIVPSYGPSQSVYVLDLRNPAAGMIEKPTVPVLSWGKGLPNAVRDSAFQPRYGAVYHALSRSILVYDPSFGLGGSIRRLIVPADPIKGSYAWETIAPGPGSAKISYPDNWRGAYSKFNIVEDMGNGQSALVLVTEIQGPVYVYKLPAGVSS